jgi:hypothetical protein
VQICGVNIMGEFRELISHNNYGAPPPSNPPNQFSYPSCKTTPFQKPNKTTRAFFICFKIDGVEKKNLATLYTKHAEYRGMWRMEDGVYERHEGIE